MDAIFPVTALQKQQGEVKKAAREGIVRITENGRGAFVFCSDEVFEQKLRQVAEDAAYEARIATVIERGRHDIEAGRLYRGTESAFAEIEKRAASHA